MSADQMSVTIVCPDWCELGTQAEHLSNPRWQDDMPFHQARVPLGDAWEDGMEVRVSGFLHPDGSAYDWEPEPMIDFEDLLVAPETAVQLARGLVAAAQKVDPSLAF